MTAAALAASAVWFLVAFVVRIALQRRMTGDSGVRRNAGPPLSTGWWARALFVTSLLAVAAGPVAVAAGAVDPIDRGSAGLGWVGVGVVVAGIAATFVAQLRMGASWRIGVDPGERTRLVTTGMFAVVRNPIFSTMALTAVGLVLMVPTAVGIAGLALLVVALELQVRAVEEPYLRDVHGGDYLAYEADVGRFVPGVGRGGRPVR